MMADQPTVIQALSAVMADVQAVRKDSRNQQQNFNFRGIDAVMNAVGPALRKHGVVIVPETVDARHRDTTTTGGKPAREATVVVTYRAYGPGGDSIPIQAPGESLDAGDKATPKAMSVAYRTALLQALTIPTDEPEPDAQTYQREAARPPDPSPLDLAKARVWRLAKRRWGEANARDSLTDYASDHDIDLADAAALQRLADQWEQEASAPRADPPPLAERPITDAQLRKLHAVMGELGITDRAERLETITATIGVTVASSKDLTVRQAGDLIDRLEAMTKETR